MVGCSSQSVPRLIMGYWPHVQADIIIVLVNKKKRKSIDRIGVHGDRGLRVSRQGGLDSMRRKYCALLCRAWGDKVEESTDPADDRDPTRTSDPWLDL